MAAACPLSRSPSSAVHYVWMFVLFFLVLAVLAMCTVA